MHEGIQQKILSLFPSTTHPLTLASDPDRLLAGEAVILELMQRGFKIIQEKDPILLRHRIEELRPFTMHHSVVVITTGLLEDLPFDLYQPAYHINLSLHQYFRQLSYPVLQTLSPEQVEKLSNCLLPVEVLSRQRTIDFLLLEVFDADPVILSQLHSLVVWLNDYHQSQSFIPDLLRISLVERLKHFPVYRDWDIDSFIREGQVFSDFIQQQWKYSLDQMSGRQIQEVGQGYQLVFAHNPQLQDLVPALVRHGTIKPLEIPDKSSLPQWTHPGVTLTDSRLQRFAFLLEDLEIRLTKLKSDPQTQSGWNVWNSLAKDWAELCNYFYQTNFQVTNLQKEKYRLLARNIDILFFGWMKNNYTPLGAQRLPKPHHVYHVPHFLAYLHSLNQLERVVLIILDGFSLSDWQEAKPVWAKRNSNWEIKTETLLAQVPTITSISRYALISGLRPVDFANDLEHCAPEGRAWELFWSREGIAGTACKLLTLNFDRGIDQLPELQDPLVRFWCLIEDTPDKLAHNATLGTADQQSSLRLWLDPAQDNNSIPLEKMVNSFLDRGYSVFITSDHGHVEATGFGQPSEGLLAQTRGKRARIYMDRLAAQRVQNAFADTILWEEDDILPDKMVALMPLNREAFAFSGEVVVTHGGITIDEAIVPFVQITKANS
jgi:hypothetical protein